MSREEDITNKLEEERRQKKAAELDDAVDQAAKRTLVRFDVSARDRDAVYSLVYTVWLGIKGGADKAKIKNVIYGQNIGFYLEKYQGLFDYAYTQLSGLQPAREPPVEPFSETDLDAEEDPDKG